MFYMEKLPQRKEQIPALLYLFFQPDTNTTTGGGSAVLTKSESTTRRQLHPPTQHLFWQENTNFRYISMQAEFFYLDDSSKTKLPFINETPLEFTHACPLITKLPSINETPLEFAHVCSSRELTF